MKARPDYQICRIEAGGEIYYTHALIMCPGEEMGQTMNSMNSACLSLADCSVMVLDTQESILRLSAKQLLLSYTKIVLSWMLHVEEGHDLEDMVAALVEVTRSVVEITVEELKKAASNIIKHFVLQSSCSHVQPGISGKLTNSPITTISRAQ